MAEPETKACMSVDLGGWGELGYQEIGNRDSEAENADIKVHY